MLRALPALLVASLLASCGGGGSDGGEGPVSPSPQPPNCTKALIVKAGPITTTGVDGDGGSGGGDGGGDGDGGLGRFFNTMVVVRDVNLEVIGRATTGSDGNTMQVRLPRGCTGPLEIEYQGNDAASYYDESTGAIAPFPQGSRMRARYDKLPRHWGVTAYTEAAVQRMEALAGISAPLDAALIKSTNEQVSEIVTDQVPGAFRRVKDGSFGQIDITRLPVVLDEGTLRVPNSLPDDEAGRYGAVIAGFAVGAAALSGEGTGDAGDVGGSLSVPTGRLRSTAIAGPGPALRAAEQLAKDLSDGRLDLQGPTGPILKGEEPPPYTYETLWRSKSIGSGLVSKSAGDDSLRTTSGKVKIAEYVFSLESAYQTETCAQPPSCQPFRARSSGGQTVRLYGDGRLSIQRGMAAAFGEDQSWVNVQTNPRELDVVVADPSTGTPLRFVDVKVGSRGEIIALQVDRKGFLYIDPMALYRVQGNEPTQGRAERLEALLPLSYQQILLSDTGAGRVVSFTPSPLQRTYPSGPAPDFLYVLSDGNLWGARRDAPTLPVRLAQPDALQAVVYDKYVPPGHAPGYGNQPAGAVQLPWSGPRRLYGLTRSGDVIAWLEGEQAAGVRVAVPGKVVLLAGESKSAVYALTADGKAYWINADQSHVADAGSTLDQRSRPSDFPRRFPLNHVEPIAGLDTPICWLARTEAVACKSGEVYRWPESLARLRYGQGNLDSTFVPTSGAVRASKVEGIGAIWRMSSVDEFYMQSVERPSLYVEGIRFITVAGETTSLEEALGQRNLLSTLWNFEDSAGNSLGQHQYLEGKQVRTALEAVFGASNPVLSRGLQVRSPTHPDHTLIYSVSPVTAGVSDMRMSVASPLPALFPEIEMQLTLRTTNGRVEEFRANRLWVGDRNTNLGPPNRTSSDVPIGAPSYNFSDDAKYRMNVSHFTFDLRYDDPLMPSGDNGVRAKVILNTILSKPYHFRLCFHFMGQSGPVTGVRFERKACTVHDNSGAFLGQIMGAANYTTYTERVRTPAGNITRIDFGEVYELD